MFNNIMNNFMGMANQTIGTMKQMGQMANDIEAVMQLVKVYKGGGNPMQLMSQMAANNPQMAQAMQMIQGKSPEQLQQMAMNMARDNNIDLGQLAQQLGLQLPQ